MTTLQVDFSNPIPGAQLRRGAHMRPCRAIAWNQGDDIDLATVYPGQDAGSLHFLSTPGSDNNRILFSEGLILETSRAQNAGGAFEGFGIAFDLRTFPHSKTIRVEASFDYAVVKNEQPFNPTSIPKIGDFIAETADTPPFFGLVTAFCTNEDISGQAYQPAIGQMGSAVMQLRYDPGATPGHNGQATRIAISGISLLQTSKPQAAVNFNPFAFLVDQFRCPIEKVSDLIHAAVPEEWNGNPRHEYEFEFLVQASQKNNPNAGGKPKPAGLGMRLVHSTTQSGNDPYEITKDGVLQPFGGQPIDASIFESEAWSDDLTPIQFAGVSFEIGVPKAQAPDPGRGPARLRLKRLVVDCT